MTAVLLAGAGIALVLASLDPAALGPAVRRIAGRLDPRRSARQREARAGLPGLVDAIGTALASGLSLPQAFAEVAPAMPAPLAVPTRRAAATLALGRGVDDALRSYDGVLPQEDVAPLAMVLGSFVRAGGRVSRSLARVAALLRGRLALEDEQRALTAQGRASAAVLLLLAPLGAVFFALAMPGYLALLIGPGYGLLVTALLLEIIAWIWLRRLLRPPRGGSALAPLIDAVVVGLDSGMTFEGSLRSLVERAPSLARLPEARRLLADLSLGRGSQQAFAAFGSAGQAEARVAALISTSTRFGAPLADLLVTQAEALRDADRRRAEAAVRRLPVLMLFPLTFCVLPALLIVFLGPPLLSLVE